MSGSTADYQEILIDGYHFRLAPNTKLQASAVDRFPGKVTVGDYSLDSNDLLSAQVISDLTGGHGVQELKEGVDDTRYRFGTIYTRFPGQFIKPFAISKATLGSGSVFPLGDLLYAGTIYRMAASGTTLYQDTTSRGAMAGVPSEKAVAFSGSNAVPIVYVPNGNNGYTAFDPATNTRRNVASPDMQAFVVWDDKLIGIDNGGQLYYATAGTAAADTTFTSYGPGGKLDAAFEPKRLHVFKNQAGESAVHVVTADNVWVFDSATPRLYRIPDFESVHPNFGLASCVWRGTMYVAGGMDILEFNGNVIRNIGLSRDEGLPWHYTGFVRDLVPAQNALYALVKGRTLLGTTHWSVHEYNGIGWCCIKTGEGTPVRAMVSNAGGAYNLHWGLNAGGALYGQTLPVNMANPREEITSGALQMGFGDFTAPYTDDDGNQAYNATYYLDTGWFDANMKGYTKIANALEVDVEGMDFDQTSETARVFYRVDGGTAWTQLGADITTSGHHVLNFGTLTNGISPGLPFEKIEFRLEYEDDIHEPYVQSQTVIVNSMVFSFLKVMNPSWSWTCQVDLGSTHNEQSPENMLAKLIALKNSGVFYPMVHRDATYRIRIAQVSGAEDTGQDTRGIYMLSLLEVPSKLGAPV